MKMINRKDYPELDLLLWDSAAKLINESEAFATYEKRWQYVDQTNIAPEEKALIERLTLKFGNGLFLSA